MTDKSIDQAVEQVQQGGFTAIGQMAIGDIKEGSTRAREPARKEFRPPAPMTGRITSDPYLSAKADYDQTQRDLARSRYEARQYGANGVEAAAKVDKIAGIITSQGPLAALDQFEEFQALPVGIRRAVLNRVNPELQRQVQKELELHAQKAAQIQVTAVAKAKEYLKGAVTKIEKAVDVWNKNMLPGTNHTTSADDLSVTTHGLQNPDLKVFVERQGTKEKVLIRDGTLEYITDEVMKKPAIAAEGLPGWTTEEIHQAARDKQDTERQAADTKRVDLIKGFERVYVTPDALRAGINTSITEAKEKNKKFEEMKKNGVEYLGSKLNESRVVQTKDKAYVVLADQVVDLAKATASEIKKLVEDSDTLKLSEADKKVVLDNFRVRQVKEIEEVAKKGVKANLQKAIEEKATEAKSIKDLKLDHLTSRSFRVKQGEITDFARVDATGNVKFLSSIKFTPAHLLDASRLEGFTTDEANTYFDSSLGTERKELDKLQGDYASADLGTAPGAYKALLEKQKAFNSLYGSFTGYGVDLASPVKTIADKTYILARAGDGNYAANAISDVAADADKAKTLVGTVPNAHKKAATDAIYSEQEAELRKEQSRTDFQKKWLSYIKVRENLTKGENTAFYQRDHQAIGDDSTRDRLLYLGEDKIVSLYPGVDLLPALKSGIQAFNPKETAEFFKNKPELRRQLNLAVSQSQKLFMEQAAEGTALGEAKGQVAEAWKLIEAQNAELKAAGLTVSGKVENAYFKSGDALKVRVIDTTGKAKIFGAKAEGHLRTTIDTLDGLKTAGEVSDLTIKEVDVSTQFPARQDTPTSFTASVQLKNSAGESLGEYKFKIGESSTISVSDGAATPRVTTNYSFFAPPDMTKTIREEISNRDAARTKATRERAKASKDAEEQALKAKKDKEAEDKRVRVGAEIDV